uniref:Uncharacterized protein n=1 Tax=Craspedostauros australis TaxID=1486917 RepID=A0A7R9WM57_9STRA|mmetsp:Transcript_10889/g.30074  ORF Transcript_10889/g.30074 Transcript_10889/m.30074 type:complete len:175 (+) Transcript_10889:170-694(+)
MTDVESTQETATTRPNQVNNPYASGIRVNSTYSPVNVFKRFAYMGICAYGLHHFRVYDAVMKSVDVHHGWFKFGLAVTSVLLLVKAYVELYAGKMKKQTVEYKNFRNSTHAVMILILISSIAFNVALWPKYGSTSLLIMTLVGVGLVNFCMLMPTEVQNLAAFVLFTFFLQEYQ